MVQKLGTVMGLDWLCDPDPSYVLTIDNLIKMLAIQMRFRYILCWALLLDTSAVFFVDQVWNSCCDHGGDWLWENKTYSLHV